MRSRIVTIPEYTRTDRLTEPDGVLIYRNYDALSAQVTYAEMQIDHLPS